MIAFLLWLLATIDAVFVGYREAAGRNALINKKTYYLKSMLRGALFGQTAIVLVGILILLLITLSSDSQILIDDLKNAGGRMLVIYIPFAVVILTAFVVRLIPSVDIKSITSTVVFGPFTFLRPIIGVIGIIYALIAVLKISVFLLGLIILLMMLGLEKYLSVFRR